LRIVWNACGGDSDFAKIVRLLILLGCRRQEIGSLRWGELDLDDGVLAIPGSRTKSGNALALVLPDAALAILSSTPRRDSVFVFGGAAGFLSWSTSMATLRRRITTPMAQWSLHDLRRTFRSGLGRIGVPPHIAERLVGHAVGGVEAIYDRYRYTSEMQNALATWASHVTSVVEGRAPTVLALKRAHRAAT
jgi:integrase